MIQPPESRLTEADLTSSSQPERCPIKLGLAGLLGLGLVPRRDHDAWETRRRGILTRGPIGQVP